jgi:hypothetical protein
MYWAIDTVRAFSGDLAAQVCELIGEPYAVYENGAAHHEDDVLRPFMMCEGEGQSEGQSEHKKSAIACLSHVR